MSSDDQLRDIGKWLRERRGEDSDDVRRGTENKGQAVVERLIRIVVILYRSVETVWWFQTPSRRYLAALPKLVTTTRIREPGCGTSILQIALA
ncbi:MAG: hypothetical protein V5A55_00945 [Halovenus sp.]